MAGRYRPLKPMPTPQDRSPGEHRIPSEPIRSLLALSVVLGGGALLASMWWWQGTRPPTGFVGAVVAMMSGVLEYYFGTQGVDHAHRLASSETRQRVLVEEGGREIGHEAVAFKTLWEATHRELVRSQAILDELSSDPRLHEKIEGISRRREDEDR